MLSEKFVAPNDCKHIKNHNFELFDTIDLFISNRKWIFIFYFMKYLTKRSVIFYFSNIFQTIVFIA